jgi:AcrR family transcriptional regulator
VEPVPGGSPGDRTAPPLLDSAGRAHEELRERADAARNRRRVLAAAQDLFAERGVAAVTMDDVAARAGVGKGTLYRRFGDKGRLAVALLDEHERALQARILAGPGPLGPGPAGVDGPAAPGERLAAFARAYLDFLDTALDLVLLSQTATVGARHATGAHAFWRAHCRYLLAAAGAPDPDVRAEVLLAALAADQVRYWRATAHRAPDELGAALSRLAHALAADE